MTEDFDTSEPSPNLAPEPTPTPESTPQLTPVVPEGTPTAATSGEQAGDDALDYETAAAILGQVPAGQEFVGPYGRQTYERAVEHGYAFERTNPALASEWATWARQSGDNLAYALSALARGEIPTAGPSAYSAELHGAGQRNAALREIRRLERETPPGHPNYTSPQHQSRLQALYALSDDGGEIVGRGGRTL